MRSLGLVAALSLASCSPSHSTAPADLATAADLAFPPTDWGTFACPQALATYCASALCPADLATARALPWCTSDLGAITAMTGTCTGLAWVRKGEIDSGDIWLYDAASGALVAVVWFANAQSGCAAGPTAVDLRSCSAGSFLCPPQPGG